MKEISKEFNSSSKKHFSPQNDLSINFIKSTTTNNLNDSNTTSILTLRLSFNKKILLVKVKSILHYIH